MNEIMETLETLRAYYHLDRLMEEKFNLNLDEFGIMCILYLAQGEKVSLKDIRARKKLLSPQNATKLVKSLINKDFITKERMETDKRQICISMTTNGYNHMTYSGISKFEFPESLSEFQEECQEEQESIVL